MYNEHEDDEDCDMFLDLHLASMEDFEKLELLLKNDKYHCWINQRDCDGCTPLRKATEVGNKESCYLLIEYGADPELLDFEDQSCLDIAAQNNDNELVEYYLIMDSDPNRYSTNNYTPLYQAVTNENKKMVEHLITYGAHVDGGLENDDIISSPLGLAISELNLPIVECLLNAGADPNIQPNPNSCMRPRINIVVINAKHPNSISENGRGADLKYIAQLSYSFLLLTEHSEDSTKPHFSKIPDVTGLRKDILLTLFAAGHKPFVTDLDPKLDATKIHSEEVCCLVDSYTAKIKRARYESLVPKNISLLFAKPYITCYKLHHPPHSWIDEEILTTIISMTSKPLPLTWLCRLEIRKVLPTTDQIEFENQDYTSDLPLPDFLKDFISLKLLYL